MDRLATLTRTVTAKRIALADVLEPAGARAGSLGLTPVELEDVLVAIGDLEDRAGTDARARLARARRALERELADLLAA